MRLGQFQVDIRRHGGLGECGVVILPIAVERIVHSVLFVTGTVIEDLYGKIFPGSRISFGIRTQFLEGELTQQQPVLSGKVPKSETQTAERFRGVDPGLLLFPISGDLADEKRTPVFIQSLDLPVFRIIPGGFENCRDPQIDHRTRKGEFEHGRAVQFLERGVVVIRIAVQTVFQSMIRDTVGTLGDPGGQRARLDRFGRPAVTADEQTAQNGKE